MPLSAYNSSFVVSGTTYGFDLNQNGYGERAEANRTIRPIPWSASYAVVVQTAGVNPIPRRYRITVWTEADYDALLRVVGQSGTLTTPRESARQAYLDSVARGDRQDVTSPTGPLTVELAFTLLN